MFVFIQVEVSCQSVELRTVAMDGRANLHITDGLTAGVGLDLCLFACPRPHPRAESPVLRRLLSKEKLGLELTCSGITLYGLLTAVQATQVHRRDCECLLDRCHHQRASHCGSKLCIDSQQGVHASKLECTCVLLFLSWPKFRYSSGNYRHLAAAFGTTRQLSRTSQIMIIEASRRRNLRKAAS